MDFTIQTVWNENCLSNLTVWEKASPGQSPYKFSKSVLISPVAEQLKTHDLKKLRNIGNLEIKLRY